ncbi:hypothetical protein CP533_2120 [Ophiocordyceps camponoti-saundersi (nom. inval.)]|nr:hypothetical protein CP533_2120 [Ophiocordyceps camponoti-saundersi (nom. inval.)]
MAWLRPRLLPLLRPSSEAVAVPRRPFSSAKDGDGADGDEGDGLGKIVASPSTTTNELQWPLLKRKSESRTEVKENALKAMANTVISPPSESSDDTEKPTLIIHGLSPYLYRSDFHRLGTGGWLQFTRSIHPLRDPSTLELDPLGRYFIGFTTEAAASSYRDNLDRLYRLARTRMLSPTGLWQKKAPADIAASTNPDQVDSLTILPASQPLHMTQNFVKRRKAWFESLGRIITAFGYPYPSDDRPFIILLRVYPPNLETATLERLIQDDCNVRKCSWRISKPFFLDKNFGSEFDAQDPLHTSVSPKRAEPLESQRRRFVFVCDNDNEAHRFRRHWNQRTLFTENNAKKERHVFHATVIHW